MTYESQPSTEKVRKNFKKHMSLVPFPTDDDCWEWARSTSRFGYGTMTDSRGPKQTKFVTHRISWEVHHGAIPEGMLVLHHCDNPRCVKPDHLYLGSQAQNMKDRQLRNRGNHAHGVKHWRSTLVAWQVIEIRRLYWVDKVPQYKLVEMFGVTQSAMSRLVRGLAYKDVPMPNVEGIRERFIE